MLVDVRFTGPVALFIGTVWLATVPDYRAVARHPRLIDRATHIVTDMVSDSQFDHSSSFRHPDASGVLPLTTASPFSGFSFGSFARLVREFGNDLGTSNAAESMM